MKKIPFFLMILLVASCSKKPDWHPLFNDDLSNAHDPEGVWTFDGNILTASADASIFTNEQYENFILDLEFKIEQGTNSGIIVYCTDREEWIPNSVEIQIGDDNYLLDQGWDPWVMSGSIFGHLAPDSSLVKEFGEWNHINIRCKGRIISVVLNGKHAVEMDMSKWTSGTKNPDGSEIPGWLPVPYAKLPTKGYIGLQGKHGEADIYFRNLRIASID